MKIPRRVLVGLTVLVIIGLVGAAAVYRLKSVFREVEKETPEITGGQKTAEKTQQIPIDAAEVFAGDLIIRISARGTVQPFRDIPLRSFTSGDLLSAPIFEGKHVRKGDLLIALDDRDYKLTFKETDAKLLKARIDYVLWKGSLSKDTTGGNGERLGLIDEFIRKAREEWTDAEQQYTSELISKAEYDSRKHNYETALALSGERRGDIIASQSGLTAAENAYARAKENLDNTKLFAPMDGKVAELQVQKGQYISAGAEICKIIDISKVRIETSVLEPDVGYLELGRKAKISLSAFPDTTFVGIVETISPVIDNAACKVTILVDNPDTKIKPGMFAFVDIDAQIYHNRLLVPKDAILQRQQRKLVMVVREGRSMWNYVNTGLSNNEFVEIAWAKDGLKPGELVAVGGHFTLAHDVPVKIVNKLTYKN